jgi:glycosyl transferase family 25
MMQLFYINLARRTDRRQAMEQRFAALELSPIRIEATTPADLTQNQLNTFCAPHHFEPMVPVELCCNLSHQRAMKLFLASGAPHAAIFEDDIFLGPALPQLLAEIDQQGLPCDLLRLETFAERNQISVKPKTNFAGFALHSMQGWHWGAAGYVINRRAAEIYLASNTLSRTIIDNVIWREYPDQKPIKTRQLYPALIVQEDRFYQTARIGSDLEAQRAERSASAGKKPLSHELRRFWRYEVKVALPALIHRTLKLSHRTTVPFAGSGVAPESNKA